MFLSLLARPLESEDEERREERLVTRLKTFMLGEDEYLLKVSSLFSLGFGPGVFLCEALQGLSELVRLAGRFTVTSLSMEVALDRAMPCLRTCS